jgi:ABC-type antimicrobial peptide transport system permease subunit
VAQVALAVVLLTASSLVVRGIIGIYDAPKGIETRGTVIFTLDFDDVQYESAAAARAAAEATRDGVRAIGGVERVAILSAVPIIGAESMVALTLPNQPSVGSPSDAAASAVLIGGTADTADILGLTLLAGQWWKEDAVGVGVVSRETAVRYFGGVERAIGQTVAVSGRPSLSIIGVVSDVANTDPTAMVPPRLWTPLADDTRRLTFAVKTRGDAAALSTGVRTVVARTAPAVPLEGLQTLDQAFHDAASSDYVIIGMLAGFAILALVLASTGLFAVVSYAAAQRTAEFGTRMALGASALDVIRLVARQSLRLLAVGLSLGLAGGIGVGFAMRNSLFGLSPLDPVTIGGVAAVLTIVTLLATAIPAWRAGRIDPIAALRAE